MGYWLLGLPNLHVSFKWRSDSNCSSDDASPSFHVRVAWNHFITHWEPWPHLIPTVVALCRLSGHHPLLQRQETATREVKQLPGASSNGAGPGPLAFPRPPGSSYTQAAFPGPGCICRMNHHCYGLNVGIPLESTCRNLTPSGMVLGGGAFRRWLDHGDSGALISGISVLKGPQRAPLPLVPLKNILRKHPLWTQKPMPDMECPWS